MGATFFVKSDKRGGGRATIRYWSTIPINLGQIQFGTDFDVLGHIALLGRFRTSTFWDILEYREIFGTFWDELGHLSQNVSLARHGTRTPFGIFWDVTPPQ